MKKTKSTNPVLTGIIEELARKTRKEDAPIWRDLAIRLSRPSRIRTKVNLSRISRHTKENDIVAVPGKVLGTGAIDHPLTIAAFDFSKTAREKIISPGGKCVTFTDLMKTVPKGTNVKIME